MVEGGVNTNICRFVYFVAIKEILVSNDYLYPPLPSPPNTDSSINIRELNSCLVADVCCCYTSLSAPGGERSRQGWGLTQRFS